MARATTSNQRAFTDRERQVEQLLILGWSNKEIAEKLQITEKTVKFHMTSIFKLSGIQSRSRYIANYYISQKIIV